ncbi:MAG: tetratricopeptide repeat protein, partial [Cyanobacteria bacterium Co-bin8]|nr:tetratricopeptide repeat protein [Cyanobacteria bacterium Co-bin8]
QLAVSPDGELIVRGTQDGRLEWYDSQGKALGITVPAHTNLVTGLAFAPDGQTLVSSSADGTIRRWDREGNPVGQPLQGSDSPITALAISPDGQQIASGSNNGSVQRWSADGTPGSPIAAHQGSVRAVTFSPDGQTLITGGTDAAVRRWNPDGTAAGEAVEAHPGGVNALASSPDGQFLVSGGADGTLQFWDAAGTPQGERVAAHEEAVTAIAISPDSQTTASVGQDNVLRLWDPSGNPRATPEGSLPSSVSDLAYTPEGNLVTSLAEGDLQLRDPQGRLRGDELPALPSNSNLPPGINNALQGLPRSVWWIIPAIPILLILVGLLWSIFGRRRSPEDPEETELEELEDVNAELVSVPVENVPAEDVPIGTVPVEDVSARVDDIAPGVPDNGYLTSPEIPPDSAWVGVPGAMVKDQPFGTTADPSLGEKLSQARADLAEGNRLASTGHYDDALNHLNSAIEAAEVERMKAIAAGTSLAGVALVMAQATASQGNVLALLGRSDRALESFNQALEIDADSIEAWVGKGRLLANMGQLDEALFCFDKALELDPSSGPAWAGKGRTLIQMGEQQEGQTYLSRAAELGGDGDPVPAESGLLEPRNPSDLTGDLLTDNISDESTLQSLADPAPASLPGPIQASTGLPQADVPAELEQVVADLPSAETLKQPAAPLADLEVPAAMQAVIAALPDEPELPEHAFITADQITNPDEWEQPIAPVILEAPPLTPEQSLTPTETAAPLATLVIDEVSLPDPEDLQEMAEALRATIDLSTITTQTRQSGDMAPENPTADITPNPPRAERPTGRVSLVEYLQPNGPEPPSGALSSGSTLVPAEVAETEALETEAEVVEPEVMEPGVMEPEVVEPEVAEPEAVGPEVVEPEVAEVVESEVMEPDADPAPVDSFSGSGNVSMLGEPLEAEPEPDLAGDTSYPSTTDSSTTSIPVEAPRAVNSAEPEPELIDSRPDNPDQGNEFADLPPEVLAALRGIPADSPDYLDVPSEVGGGTVKPPAVPANPRLAQLLPDNLADLPTSWMTLAQETGGERLYTVWEISDLERTAAKQEGGETLMIRLYDVTRQPAAGSLPAPIDQQACYELAKDWYLALPEGENVEAQSTRTYLAEVGYQTNTGEWLSLALSNSVTIGLG